MLKKLTVQPVILAAGRGKRILEEAKAEGLGELPKVLYPLSNKPLIDYVIDTISEVKEQLPDEIDLLKPIAVVNFMQHVVRNHLRDRVVYVEQKPAPLGTGHAVQVCQEAVERVQADVVLVLNGDMPAWSPQTISNLIIEHAKKLPAISLGTVEFNDPQYNANFFAYGRIVRDAQGRVKKIVEQKDASQAEQAINECNPSLYLFDSAWLFEALKKIKNNNIQKEYYLTDLLQIAIEQKEGVITAKIQNWREALGVNTLEQLKMTEELLAS